MHQRRPEFELPIPPSPPPQASRFGWFAFAFVYALILALGFVAMFGLDRATDAERALEEVESSLRYEILAGRLTGGDDALKKAAASGLADLEGVEGEEAAMLRVVLSREAGVKIDQRDIEHLESYESPMAYLYAELYGDPPPSAERALEISKELTSDWIAEKLARSHALETAGIARGRHDLSSAGSTALVVTVSILAILPLAGVGLWIAYFALRKRGSLVAQGWPRALRDVTLSGKLALLAAALLIAMVLIQLASAVVLEGDPAMLNFIAGALMIIAVPLVVRMRHGRVTIGLREVLGDCSNLKAKIAWGVSAAAANVPLALALALIGTSLAPFAPEPSHPISEELRLAEGAPMMLLSLFFVAAMVAPFFEEVVFRGLLTPALGAALRNPVLAVVISSVLFALIHPQGPTIWPALAGTGAVAAIVAYQTQSLIPAIVMHAVHNGLILTIHFVLEM